MEENTYQLIKEFKHRDLDGVDHFRYFVEKNGDPLSHTLSNSLEEAEKWYDSLVSPQKPLPSKTTILRTDIIDGDKEWKDKFDNGLSKLIGFDAKSLDDLDIRPKD